MCHRRRLGLRCDTKPQELRCIRVQDTHCQTEWFGDDSDIAVDLVLGPSLIRTSHIGGTQYLVNYARWIELHVASLAQPLDEAIDLL